jgi:hypothetical protein
VRRHEQQLIVRTKPSRKIATAKLIQDLTNTNVQNHQYYHKSPKCPCCLTMDETFAHVLPCCFTASNEHRSQALQELHKDLKSIDTPSEVVDTMSHGISMWLHHQNNPECVVWALTAGSLKGTGMLLIMAFHELFHTIGWYNMFQGRLSKLWGHAVLQISKSPYSSFSTTWTAQTILYLWTLLGHFGCTGTRQWTEKTTKNSCQNKGVHPQSSSKLLYYIPDRSQFYSFMSSLSFLQ